MRGKESSTRSHQRNIRITPAYAGKSFIPAVQSEFAKDHPRLCGEKPYAKKTDLTAYGSPPPMRGKA